MTDQILSPVVQIDQAYATIQLDQAQCAAIAEGLLYAVRCNIKADCDSHWRTLGQLFNLAGVSIVLKGCVNETEASALSRDLAQLGQCQG